MWCTNVALGKYNATPGKSLMFGAQCLEGTADILVLITLRLLEQTLCLKLHKNVCVVAASSILQESSESKKEVNFLVFASCYAEKQKKPLSHITGISSDGFWLQKAKVFAFDFRQLINQKTRELLLGKKHAIVNRRREGKTIRGIAQTQEISNTTSTEVKTIWKTSQAEGIWVPGQKRWECDLCNISAADNADLYLHVETISIHLEAANVLRECLTAVSFIFPLRTVADTVAPLGEAEALSVTCALLSWYTPVVYWKHTHSKQTHSLLRVSVTTCDALTEIPEQDGDHSQGTDRAQNWTQDIFPGTLLFFWKARKKESESNWLCKTKCKVCALQDLHRRTCKWYVHFSNTVLQTWH